MRPEIDQDRVEAAMQYLAGTDADYADAIAAQERAEILRKRVRARVFLVEDGTVAERQAKAETYADTGLADDEFIKALKTRETLKARRQRAELLIDVWRTLEASRRKA